MKKTTVQLLCGLGIVLPLVLLLWPMPYIMWRPSVAAMLRIIPAVSAQVLLFRVTKSVWLRLAPLILTGFSACRGTFLFFTSEAWAGSGFSGLLADCVSPLIGCMLVWGVHCVHKNQTADSPSA